MKKTVLMFATAALAALSLSTVAGNKVSAATTADTKATIDLSADTTVGDGSGKIQLVQAPSFTFASQAINSSADTTSTVAGDKSLKVINPGVAAVWNVAVNAGEFKSTEKGNTSVLKGAKLALAGTVSADDNAANKAAFTDATLDTTTADTSKAANLFASKATEGGFTGVGTNAEDITGTLTVPAGNVAGSYSSDLNWTLSQTPSDDAE